MTTTAYLVETPHDHLYPIYRYVSLEAALDNACAIITALLADPSFSPCRCPFVRERLRRMIGRQDFDTAIHEWNQYQNQRGEHEWEVVIHRVVLEERVVS